MSKRELGRRKNTLLRYKDVCEIYQQKKAENEYMYDNVIHLNFIYPRIRISRVTMYIALATNYKKELKFIEEIENLQQKLDFAS